MVPPLSAMCWPSGPSAQFLQPSTNTDCYHGETLAPGIYRGACKKTAENLTIPAAKGAAGTCTTALGAHTEPKRT